MCSTNPNDDARTPTPHWSSPALFPELVEGAIHVWSVSLVSSLDEGDQLRQLLSDDERQRADRFIFPRHRQRFAVGRARMRQILAHYLGRPPQSLQFDYSPLGKPSLRSANEKTLQFNFSNSHTVGLLAVSRSTDSLGVDVERVRRVSDMEGLARRFFAAAEIARISGCPAGDRAAEFFRCWTRKEAYLKAVGHGLTFPLDKVIVSTSSSEPARFTEIDGSQAEAARWLLAHLRPCRDYLGAIAWPGPPHQVQEFAWPAV